jgi:RimJ/RimL family protein N-acetyltransferase
MAPRILPIAEEHIESFRAAVDSVAREHRYLALLEAPELEAVREFVRDNIRKDHPQFVALVDGSVVGWCDIVPKAWPSLRHSGILGMGVIQGFRGQGIGGALIAVALEAAKRKGLTRIELTVRTDNEPARKLYEKFGFVHEGRLLRHLLIDGEYRDSDLMALLF